MYDVSKIREDFPIFKNRINNRPIIYLDSAASAQKPKCMIDKIVNIYQNSYANVHRSMYDLAEAITIEYENARHCVAEFISADKNEIVFTRNATEAINLVASSWAEKNLNKDDEILICKKYHSNKELFLNKFNNPLHITLDVDKDVFINKITDDKVINITGESGSGKSFYTNKYINNDDYIVIDTDLVFSDKDTDYIIRELDEFAKLLNGEKNEMPTSNYGMEIISAPQEISFSASSCITGRGFSSLCDENRFTYPDRRSKSSLFRRRVKYPFRKKSVPAPQPK